jgi:predicted NodU family carbamoyl transferase
MKEIKRFDVVAVEYLLKDQQQAISSSSRETGHGGEIRFIGHHDAHAASACFCSPFEEAAVPVVDGLGSSAHADSYDRIAEANWQASADAHELQSYNHGKGNRLSIIEKTFSSNTYPHGIGHIARR